MIKHLKRKFLVIAFSSIFIVLGIIVSYINYHNYTTTTQKHIRVIDRVISNDGVLDNLTEFEKILHRNIIIIKYENDTLTLVNGTINDEYTVDSLYEGVLSTNQTNGNYNNYIFKINNNDTSSLIVLSNFEIDRQLINSFLYSSLMISVIGMSLVFVIIYFSSSYVLKPFIKNEEAQKEFITNASHELKTPITIIKANLDVLKIDNIDNEWTQSIESQTSRLELLTNNMINLSKVNESNNNNIKTDFSLSDAIDEELSNYTLLFKEKDILLNNNIKQNISFQGNEKEIRDVIKLLLDNVVKYSHSGSLIIKFENKELYFCNSTDLNDGNYDYIFNRFTRLDESRNQTVSGFGIGLSIVKKILENHQCNVNAYVEANTFIIKIKI